MSTMAHSFSSMARRQPEAEAELRSELLTLLDGSPLDEGWVSETLGGRFALDRSSLEQQHAVHGNMGVLDTGQSLSADLRVLAEATADGPAPQRGLYIKKIQAKRFAHKKSPESLRRDLASCHNECSFYAAIAPLLQAGEEQRAAAVRIPRCYYVGENSFHSAESEAQMADSEYMLVLESMTQQFPGSGGAVCQHSPLRCVSPLQTTCCVFDSGPIAPDSFCSLCLSVSLYPIAMRKQCRVSISSLGFMPGLGTTQQDSRLSARSCSSARRTGTYLAEEMPRCARCRRSGRAFWRALPTRYFSDLGHEKTALTDKRSIS